MNSFPIWNRVLDDLIVLSVVNLQSFWIVLLFRVSKLDHLLNISINVVNYCQSPRENLLDKLLNRLYLNLSILIHPFNLNINEMYFTPLHLLGLKNVGFPFLFVVVVEFVILVKIVLHHVFTERKVYGIQSFQIRLFRRIIPKWFFLLNNFHFHFLFLLVSNLLLFQAFQLVLSDSVLKNYLTLHFLIISSF